MGGKKKKSGFFDKAAGVVTGAAKSGMQLVSGGTYDPNTGSWKAGTQQLYNVGEAVSGGTLEESMSPAVSKGPVAEDPSIQAKRAEAEAAAKLEKEIGERGRGLSSTILGGSTSDDKSVLKKRKLLGE